MLAPGVEMRLVDDEGKDVGLDQGDKGNPGELWFRGPNIFKGYLNNKEATEDCMTKDGFFKTGDVAIYLKDQIYIVDRKVRGNFWPSLTFDLGAVADSFSLPTCRKSSSNTKDSSEFCMLFLT
jgi:acyl-CoA synthetase (AMP-forming)/AMP-acid ligase II